MPQTVRTPRVHVHAAGTHRRACLLRLLGVVPAEIEPVRNLVKRTVKAQRGNERILRVVVAVLWNDPSEDARAHHGIDIVATAHEEDAPKTLRSPFHVRRKRVRRRGEDSI